MGKIKVKFSKEFWLLAVILLVGAFLRLYKIDQYLTFLGDEGRDVIVVRRLLVNFDPILIGPGTSIGNMYLGPLYYYLMAPFLWLASYSPVGPAAAIALLGVATIWFVWFLGKKWFGKGAGLVAAALYAISPTVIIYSRSSWNPNIMPFFALLSIYALWQVWQERKFKWLIVLGISHAFILQSHYLGLLLIPTFFLFWFLTLRKVKNDLEEKRKLIKNSFIGAVIFLFLMSPLVIFDARHGWRNFASMKKFFTVRQETVSIKPWKAIPKFYPLLQKVNTRLVTAKNQNTGAWLTLAVIILLCWNLLIEKDFYQKHKNQFWLLFSWLGFGLIGLGLYKQEIYDHYFGFFFAGPFLLISALAASIWERKRKGSRIFLMFVSLFLIWVNYKECPLKFPPNQQLRRAKEVAQRVAAEAKGEKFNFAVIAERNYESGYRYFLEMEGEPVVDIDAQEPKTITDQLFVVCEMLPEKCDPTHNSKAEVANFGWSKIENTWEVFGTRLYKLVHTQK